MYTVDLHNHTKFSYDGSNTPEEIIENAIRHGVDVIGITDHQFSIGENLPIYYEYIQHCKIKYADQIKVLCGLEIGTRPTPPESVRFPVGGRSIRSAPWPGPRRCSGKN